MKASAPQSLLATAGLAWLRAEGNTASPGPAAVNRGCRLTAETIKLLAERLAVRGRALAVQVRLRIGSSNDVLPR
eukprot:SAG22_NODE_216_length_14937_cov_51.622995_9_plen_75_part_00